MASEKESGFDNHAFDADERANALRDEWEEKGSKAHEVNGMSPAACNKPTYCVTDVPPWYLCIFLAIQHYLTSFGGNLSIALIISEALCLQHDSLTQSYLINNLFFVSGLITLMQIIFGVRLPILQGGTFALVTPAVALLSLPEWKCPAWTQNATLVNTSSPEFIEMWQTRMQTLQGSIMVASLIQVVVGFSGFIGFLMRFIGPLTIAPTVSLIGLSLYSSAGDKAGSHWGISAMTAGLIILFSQYLCRIPIPVPVYSKSKGLHSTKFFLFQSMPVLLSVMVSWLVCYLLTIYEVLPSDPEQYGYLARTDVKGNVLSEASWFMLPYPGQWGRPSVSLAGVIGLIAGLICSMAESVGDYHSCAKLSGACPPPKHAINRGIGVEGLGSLLAGAFGTGNGTTSFSENVAVLGITKVGSRTVVLLSGVFMILIGILGKIGAVFSTIPTPVLGGMFLIMFGIIGSAGISNLRSTDMYSSRNILIFGFSMFSAFVIPDWIRRNPGLLETGVSEVDQALQILFSTHMFVGGFFGFVLDNTIPGTKQERGLSSHNEDPEAPGDLSAQEVYELPFGVSSFLKSKSWARYIPFCPSRETLCEKQDEDSRTPQRRGSGHSVQEVVEHAL